MPPIVSIVGKSDSGKTTLLEKLVGEIRSRGYRVGSIKHDTHGFDIDHEGKDSWRHKKAGSSAVIISSPNKIALIKDTEEDKPIDDLAAQYLQDLDIIFTEGYKRENKPKIEVFRKDMHRERLCQDDDNLIAMATDQHFDLSVPCFDINDVEGLAGFVEERFLKPVRTASVSLVMDGRYVSLKPFIEEMFVNSISGMVEALKGGKGSKSIQISVTLPGRTR